MRDVLEKVDEWRAEGQQVAMATVIKTGGSTPRPLGSRLAISETGDMVGSVSGGCIEGAVFQEAQSVLADGVAKRLNYGITDEQAWTVGLSCGGDLEVLLQRVD